jgi:hypothetical protein
MLPAFGNAALKIDPATEEISVADAFQAECERDAANALYPNRFFMIKEIKDDLLAYAGGDGALIEYRTGTGALRRERLRLPPEDGKTLTEIFFDADTPADCVFHEGAPRSLGAYLEYVTACAASPEARPASRSALAENPDGSAGRAIYARCKAGTS